MSDQASKTSSEAKFRHLGRTSDQADYWEGEG